MKVQFNSQLTRKLSVILEEAGYHFFVDPRTKKESYVMRVGRGFYPRYHLYVKAAQDGSVILDLHIDQKKASYKGQRAHSGEYEGPMVEEEIARIGRWLTHYTQR